MTEREWRDRGADLKLMSLLLIKRIRIVILGTVLGAAICGGIYFLCHVVYAPAREYEAVSKLYLTFAADDDGDAYQYYNGYTWNDLMGTEPILDYAMECVRTCKRRCQESRDGRYSVGYPGADGDGAHT